MVARLLGLAAATITIAVTTHAGLLWLLLWTGAVAAVTAPTTSKSQATEKRVNNLAAQQATLNATVQDIFNGNPEFSGNVTVDGSLTVLSAFGVHGNGTCLGTWGVSNDSHITGTLTVDGDVDAGSGTVTGDDLVSNASTTVFGALGVHGNTTMLGTLNGHTP